MINVHLCAYDVIRKYDDDQHFISTRDCRQAMVLRVGPGVPHGRQPRLLGAGGCEADSGIHE